MISSTSYRNKGGKSGTGPALVLILFALSLSFAFGIGYRLGRASAPAAPASSDAARKGAAGRGSQPPPSSAQSRAPWRAAMEKTQMVWAPLGKSKYTLYLASFQKFSEAEKEKGRLESKGLKGIEITEKRIAGTGSLSWYRLSYGRFDTQEAAAEYGRRLTERGLIRDFWPKELL